MPGFSVESKGDFARTLNFLQKTAKSDFHKRLDGFGREGVAALSAATPVDSKKTASSWDYKVKKTSRGYEIIWFNDQKTDDGDPIAVILQYGHGTGTGGYVQGRDYINPAMRPVFDNIADKAWKAVTSV